LIGDPGKVRSERKTRGARAGMSPRAPAHGFG